MKRAMLFLTVLLVGSLAQAGVPFGRVPAQPRDATVNAAQGQEAGQAGGASAELSAGRALLARGNASEALIRLERALELFRQAGSKGRRGAASAHDQLGKLYERHGRYDLALEQFKEAHKIYASNVSQKKKEKLSPYDAELMLAKIGRAHYQLGEMDEARAAFMRMSDEKPNKKKSAAEKGAGGASQASDNPWVRAAGGLGASMLGAKTEYENYRKGIVYSAREIGLGRIAYFSDQPKAAQKHFENALKVTQGGIASLAKVGQTRSARAAARTALGDISLLGLDYKKAAKQYEEAIDGAKKDKQPDLTWPAQRGMGRALWLQAEKEPKPKNAEKLRGEALAAYRDALNVIGTLREGSLRADEARTTFLATTNDVFVEASSLQAEVALAAAAAKPGAPHEGHALTLASQAFEIVEEGRARSLLDLLRETGSNVTADAPAALLRRKQDNLSRQAETVAHIEEEIAEQNEDEGPPDKKSKPDEKPKKKKSLGELESELVRLQADYESIENSIRAESPAYDSLTSAKPRKLSEVQRQVLDPETALLEYSLGEEASYLWLVTRDEIRLFRLPARSALDEAVEELRKRMIPAGNNTSILRLSGADEDDARGLRLDAGTKHGDPRAFSTASHALYKSVLEQAAPFVVGKRLLVVGDGSLNYVPFEALVTAPGGAEYAKLPYLALTNEIVYAPSASVIAAIRKEASSATTLTAGDSILLIADPVFHPSDPRAAKVTQPAPASTHDFGLGSAVADVAGAQAGSPLPRNVILKRLHATAREAKQIEQYAGSANLKVKVWRDFDANEANVNGDLRQYRVLHFATHGLLNAERPQFSGIVLSLVGNRDGRDGFLRTDEVFNLKLGSPLVMLSACETGLGKEKRGEGVIGLTRAFMYAGAKTVGVTLWSVNDASTAKLMGEFYNHFLTKKHSTPVGAMRAAREAMIADERFNAPYYWAGFVLVGEWQ
jgi:CHAT domain-containing protein/tetratricopeptide (TPR) repeat protein